jgi:predicted RNase H-like nuclease (RuvC/YqgF family)
MQMRAEIEKKDSEVAALMNALKEQGDRIAQLERLVPKSKLAQLDAVAEDA